MVNKLNNKDFNFIPFFEQEKYILVCNKNYEAKLKAENTFLVKKEDWLKKDSSNPNDLFSLYHTECNDNQIKLKIDNEGKCIEFSRLPLPRRNDYLEISFDKVS